MSAIWLRLIVVSRGLKVLRPMVRTVVPVLTNDALPGSALLASARLAVFRVLAAHFVEERVADDRGEVRR